MACPQLHKPYILLLSSSIIAVDDCRWNVVGFNQLHQQPLPYLRLTPNDLNIIPRPERFWNKASIFNLILTMSNRLSDIYSLRCKKKSGQYNIYRASMTVKYIYETLSEWLDIHFETLELLVESIWVYATGRIYFYCERQWIWD